MLYDGLAIVIVTIGALVLLIALRVLLRSGWLLGWLRGMTGLVLTLLAAVFVFAAWDVFSYHEIQDEKSIATISFEVLGEQHYRAILVSGKGLEKRFELKGDQWQLDARIFKWKGPLTRFGMKPGYRLDRLAGRYYSLEKERTAERTVYALNASEVGVDVWKWFNRIDKQISWLDALYGSATFVPMSDGALYEINLSHSGLLARPLNERAQNAVNRWQ